MVPLDHASSGVSMVVLHLDHEHAPRSSGFGPLGGGTGLRPHSSRQSRACLGLVPWTGESVGARSPWHSDLQVQVRKVALGAVALQVAGGHAWCTPVASPGRRAVARLPILHVSFVLDHAPAALAAAGGGARATVKRRRRRQRGRRVPRGAAGSSGGSGGGLVDFLIVPAIITAVLILRLDRRRARYRKRRRAGRGPRAVRPRPRRFRGRLRLRRRWCARPSACSASPRPRGTPATAPSCRHWSRPTCGQSGGRRLDGF